MSLSLTLSRLRELRLGAMAKALERQLEQSPTYDDLSFTERMGLLVERECLERERCFSGELSHIMCHLP